MKKPGQRLSSVLPLLGVFLMGVFATVTPANANHSWNGYHWARTANPFTLQLGDNVSVIWDPMLQTASNDWSNASVLNTTIVAGGTSPRRCRPTAGRVEVCSASYGNTGWLGLAQIWITGGVHIVQGVVKNNDYYFGASSYQYNNAAEMQHVICQEIGHTLGLDHQDTSGASLDTCMDYYHNKSASDTLSTHPNQHDYDELQIIYTHPDSTTTVASSVASGPGHGNASDDVPAGVNEHYLPPWAGPAAGDVYEVDLGNGVRIVTHVIWVRSRPGARP
jgi:hypothetical protein